LKICFVCPKAKEKAARSGGKRSALRAIKAQNETDVSRVPTHGMPTAQHALLEYVVIARRDRTAGVPKYRKVPRCACGAPAKGAGDFPSLVPKRAWRKLSPGAGISGAG